MRNPAPGPETAEDARHPAGTESRCKNALPPCVAFCPRCGGSLHGIPPLRDSAPPAADSLPATFAWLLAFLPLILWMLLVLLEVAILPVDIPDETLEGFERVLFWIAALLSFAVNDFLLRKEGELLAQIRRRDEMLAFMHYGIFCPPVYLCARAAKIDKNLAPAIVGTILGFFWWLIVLS